MTLIITFNVLAAAFLLFMSRRRTRSFDAGASAAAIRRIRSKDESAHVEIGGDAEVAAMYQSWLTSSAAK
ncbi:MAG: hypothetical protein U0166_07180 [Acidobacteriota bacterium]